MFIFHFEFIFVYDVQKYSNFTLLYVAISFVRKLIEKTVFFSLYVLASFVVDYLTITTWLIVGLSILFSCFMCLFCASTILF